MQTVTIDAFVEWLKLYGQAWERGDPEAAVQLFTEDGVYHAMPFDEPLHGCEAIRKYWTDKAQDSQENVSFSCVPVAVTDTSGLARWSASLDTIPDGHRIEIEGFLEAEFAEPGVCSYFREWWHARKVESP